MSKTVGIICEYNPFHKGHMHLIDEIKLQMPDATIVAIMSGNIVQRGEFAIMDKYKRAEIALECGVNAVFELPYPYSGSTAEIFANAGVEIAIGLGCDYLFFGAESLSCEQLHGLANAIDSQEFEERIAKLLENKSTSYIIAKKLALESMGYALSSCSNDMLAIEYVRAIKRKNAIIEYKTVKRVGAVYNDTSVCDIMSASAIRKNFYEKNEIISVPKKVEKLYNQAINEGMCLNKSYANGLLHSFALLNGDCISKAFDSNSEIEALIKRASMENATNEEFVASLSSKVFTTARLKRVLLYSMLGIENVDFTPKFTVLLGMDKKGQELIGNIRKSTNLAIITKHSDGKGLDEKTFLQLEKLYETDALYNTLTFKPSPPNQAYKNKPIIK